VTPSGKLIERRTHAREQKEAEIEGKIQQNQWFQQLKKSSVPGHLLYL
jgi:hypothetical protein